MPAEPTPLRGERLEAFTASLLERCMFPPAGTSVTCAFSGGADSTALVALAVRAGCDVHAVHIDHGLRASSADDASLAAAAALALGATFSCEHARLRDGPNLEARAREARRTLLGPDALTGHTADDQAETALLALMRGAGATGLAAMTPGPAKPIIDLRRAETHQLCALLGLVVAVDPTNDDPRFRRNRVRHELLPMMDDIADRDVSALIGRTSALVRDDDAYLDQLALALDPTDALALADAPLPLARRAVRRWLQADGYPPDAAAVDRVLAVAAGSAISCEISGGRRVERSRQQLRLSPESVSTG